MLGAWVAVSDPASVGFGGGAKLFENAQDGSLWDTKTEGFGVAVMHQLHCVVRPNPRVLTLKVSHDVIILGIDQALLY